MCGEEILAHRYAETGPVGDLDLAVLNQERFFDEFVQERVGAERVLDDEPGGLTWAQLTDLVMALFAGPVSCVGGSLAIYDPDQDPERAGAAKIVAFIRNVLVRPTISP